MELTRIELIVLIENQAGAIGDLRCGEATKGELLEAANRLRDLIRALPDEAE